MKVLLFAWASLAALVISLAPAVARADQPPRAVDITLSDYALGLPATGMQAGVPIKFTVHNQGGLTHEVVLERAGATDEALEIDGKAAELPDIAPGETRTVTWTIPQPGEYQLACHIPGHLEAGMVQRFTVLAPGSNGSSAPQAASEQAALVSPALSSSAVSGTPPAAGASTRAWAQRWLVAVVLAGAALGLLALELVRRLERGYLDSV